MSRILLICAAGLMLAGCGGSEKKNTVPIDLSLPAKLDLTNYDRIYFPGFISDVKNEFFDPETDPISNSVASAGTSNNDRRVLHSARCS